MKYNWKRFLCGRDEDYSLDSEGFLSTIEGKYFQTLQPNLSRMEDFEDFGGLVILGEPGIGKSVVLENEFTRHSSNDSTSNNSLFLYKNLNGYNTDFALTKDIFENDVVREWVSSKVKILYLYLDSLDEALLNIKVVSQLISSKLRSLPVERLKLRISCRTGVWPIYLEKNLKECFGENLKVLELVCLTKDDVKEACAKEGVDNDKFIDEVIAKGVVPLVIKPNTLKFLIRLFKVNGSFPTNRIKLFEEGCKLHCTELNDSRISSRLTSTLDSSDLLDLASRIAVLTILCNKTSISLPGGNVTSPDKLNFSDIISTSDLKIEGSILLNEAQLNEVLQTGLFVSKGPLEMGWAHQSYAEYLAARYLSNKSLNIKQLESLFFDKQSSRKKLVPVIQQTAVWLSSFNNSFFEIVLESDPEVILRSDLSQSSDEIKEKLLKNLIVSLETESSLVAFDSDLKQRFKWLNYKGIEKIIVSKLEIPSINNDLKRFLVDLIEECKLVSCSKNLLDIALDNKQNHAHRVNSAYALKRIGREVDKMKLIDLLQEVNDPSDELKGCALSCLWPNHISFSSMKQYLTPPKRKHFLGAYGYFLGYELVDHIQSSDICTALEWAKNHCTTGKGSRFSDLVDSIMVKSFDYLNDESIIDALGEVIVLRLSNHDQILSRDEDNKIVLFQENKIARQRILANYMKNLSGEDLEKSHIVFIRELVYGLEIRWLLDFFERLESVEKKKKFATLIRIVSDLREEKTLKNVLQFYEKHKEIKEEFLWQIGPIELGSQTAIRMKEYFDFDKKRQRNDNMPKDLEFNIRKSIEKSLDVMKTNNNDGFYNLMSYLCVDLEDGCSHDEVLDVVDGGSWKLIRKDEVEVLLESGKTFLKEFEFDISESYSNATYNKIVLSGLKFLRLMFRFDYQGLSDLDCDIWKKWIPPLILYPTFNYYNDDFYKRILQLAFSKDSHAFFSTLKIILFNELMRKDEHIFIFNKVRSVMDQNLARKLFVYVKGLTKDIPIEKYISTMGEFLKLGVEESGSELKELFYPPYDYPQESRSIAAKAALTLFLNSNKSEWEVIYPCLVYDKNFGKEIFLQDSSFIYEFEGRSILSKFSDLEIGELYIWMVENFPYEESCYEGVRWSGPKEEAERLRSSLLDLLIERGTNESCFAIEKAILKFPQYAFLKRCLLNAESRRRVVQWNIPTPFDLLCLCSHENSRFVYSYDDLVDVVVDVLRKFESELHCETPAVADIWNTEKERIKPKTEDEFSDRVKRYLDSELSNRGVVVNREVEIRRNPAGARTDIHVDAIVQDIARGSDVITVIIESKGDWNKGVFESMESQLAYSYLAHSKTKHGIYLIANFYCEEWTKEDYRKAIAFSNDVKNSHDRLTKQSVKLNSEGYFITPFIMNTSFRGNKA